MLSTHSYFIFTTLLVPGHRMAPPVTIFKRTDQIAAMMPSPDVNIVLHACYRPRHAWTLGDKSYARMQRMVHIGRM